MNCRNILMAVPAMLFSLNGLCQGNGLYEKMPAWSVTPALHKLPSNFKGQSAVYLMDSRTFHYKFEGKNLFQFNYVYRLVKVEDDKGIEMFNKIYLPIPGGAELYDIRARVITSTGKIINVPANKIKEEEEDGNKYKLFAMEGLDKGAEVEYCYTVKRNPSFFGSETFQTKAVPFHQARFLVITPRHLKFDAKGFNGFSVLKDSVISEERYIPGFSSDIPELDDEKYGLRDAYLQRADYKFSYNLAQNNDVELYTWKELSRNAFNNTSTFNDKEKKAIAKFVDNANIPATANEETTIRLLEDFMKTRINVDNKLVSEDANNMDAVIKNGNTNNFGAVRFFVAMLENKNIKYQIVFPSVRNQLPLDEDLANWNRINETLIYFPATKKFIEPSASAVRYPFVDPYWAGTRGLFIKGTQIGDVKTAIGKFEDIAIEPLSANAHNMEVYAKLDPSADSLIITSKQILTGYAAMNYRPLWAYLPKDKQEEAVKEIIKSVAKSDNIKNISCENTLLTDSWTNKPLVINATIHTAELLEKAGNKLLVKLGEFIGNQEQMYQEKTRRLPAEIAYPHIMERKLSFEIPAGYTVKNLESIIVDVQHKIDGEVNMGFVSSYKMENNVLQVYVLETYKDLKYPLTQFESFKQVINAAADFNKVVLVLEKKG